MTRAATRAATGAATAAAACASVRAAARASSTLAAAIACMATDPSAPPRPSWMRVPIEAADAGRRRGGDGGGRDVPPPTAAAPFPPRVWGALAGRDARPGAPPAPKTAAAAHDSGGAACAAPPPSTVETRWGADAAHDAAHVAKLLLPRRPRPPAAAVAAPS